MQLLLSLLLGFLAVAGPALASPAQGAGAAPGPRALAPEERGRFRENLERWRQLSPEEKQRIWGNYEHWRQLSPQEQEIIRRRFEDFRKLPPQERQRLREEFRGQRGGGPGPGPGPQSPGGFRQRPGRGR